MTTPLVLLVLALLAGAVVWVLSMRVPRPPRASTGWYISASVAVEPELAPVDLTENPEPDPAPAGVRPAAADSFAYMPLGLSDGLSVKTRLFGILGLVALIVLTSAAVAFGVWMLGRAIGLQLSHFATG